MSVVSSPGEREKHKKEIKKREEHNTCPTNLVSPLGIPWSVSVRSRALGSRERGKYNRTAAADSELT